MRELTRQEAKARVERRLVDAGGVPCTVVDESTIEKPWGWVFFYQSTRYLETQDFSDQLAGNAPYIVNRYTGELRSTGTARSIDHYIAEYEKLLG